MYLLDRNICLKVRLNLNSYSYKYITLKHTSYTFSAGQIHIHYSFFSWGLNGLEAISYTLTENTQMYLQPCIMFITSLLERLSKYTVMLKRKQRFFKLGTSFGSQQVLNELNRTSAEQHQKIYYYTKMIKCTLLNDHQQM